MSRMRDTIKNHNDFLMTETDPIARCAFCLIRAKNAKFPDDARYGLVATKKTFRHAVDRNRAKRLLRDWVRHNQKLMRPDMDYVFIARRAILGATRTEGRVAIKKALRYLSRLPIAKNAEES